MMLDTAPAQCDPGRRSLKRGGITAADVMGKNGFSQDGFDPLICPWGTAQMLRLRCGNIDNGQFVPSQTVVGLLGGELLRHMKRTSPGRQPVSLSGGRAPKRHTADYNSTLALHRHSSGLSLKKPSLTIAKM
ncbi:hypothetical protein NQZ68_016371 [Dissostichus eleginoides]|nr:hypothetical protein NQZ68_016371 [Dissostichus eleginoides]